MYGCLSERISTQPVCLQEISVSCDEPQPLENPIAVLQETTVRKPVPVSRSESRRPALPVVHVLAIRDGELGKTKGHACSFRVAA
ncbi:hypothetical protein BJY04DRAFT_191145 [Aspergillus karnatakaensis]|uniref:uncharacterized protein n=1 Tax=Aspergillus karnatakaensis TaxID=1810916 RepID=UPI003CCCCBDE